MRYSVLHDIDTNVHDVDCFMSACDTCIYRSLILWDTESSRHSQQLQAHQYDQSTCFPSPFSSHDHIMVSLMWISLYKTVLIESGSSWYTIPQTDIIIMWLCIKKVILAVTIRPGADYLRVEYKHRKIHGSGCQCTDYTVIP